MEQILAAREVDKKARLQTHGRSCRLDKRNVQQQRVSRNTLALGERRSLAKEGYRLGQLKKLNKPSHKSQHAQTAESWVVQSEPSSLCSSAPVTPRPLGLGGPGPTNNSLQGQPSASESGDSGSPTGNVLCFPPVILVVPNSGNSSASPGSASAGKLKEEGEASSVSTPRDHCSEGANEIPPRIAAIPLPKVPVPSPKETLAHIPPPTPDHYGCTNSSTQWKSTQQVTDRTKSISTQSKNAQQVNGATRSIPTACKTAQQVTGRSPGATPETPPACVPRARVIERAPVTEIGGSQGLLASATGKASIGAPPIGRGRVSAPAAVLAPVPATPPPVKQSTSLNTAVPSPPCKAPSYEPARTPVTTVTSTPAPLTRSTGKTEAPKSNAGGMPSTAYDAVPLTESTQAFAPPKCNAGGMSSLICDVVPSTERTEAFALHTTDAGSLSVSPPKHKVVLTRDANVSTVESPPSPADASTLTIAPVSRGKHPPPPPLPAFPLQKGPGPPWNSCSPGYLNELSSFFTASPPIPANPVVEAMQEPMGYPDRGSHYNHRSAMVGKVVVLLGITLGLASGLGIERLGAPF